MFFIRKLLGKLLNKLLVADIICLLLGVYINHGVSCEYYRKLSC